MSKRAQKSGASRYIAHDTKLRDFCQSLIESRSRRQARKQYGVFVLNGADERSDIGRRLERDVFFEYFGNDEQVFAEEYGPYEDDSELIVVIDQKALIPVGVIRLVRYGTRGLKTLNDTTHSKSPWDITLEEILTRHAVDPSTTWDIATLAVKRRYRSKRLRRLIRALLFHELYRHAIRNKAVHWVAILDDIHLRTFYKLGVPLDSLGGVDSKPYLGSASSRPIIVPVEQVAGGVRGKSRFNHFLLIQGSVLRRIASFP